MLEKSSPDVFKKLIPIEGDVSVDGLGISQSDRSTLLNNVNVVIHSAASLDFNETLRTTVNINLLGTRRVLDLCKQIKDLKAFVQVSSAYVNSWRLDAEEILYPLPNDLAEKAISMVESLSDEALLEITPNLLGEHVNTYTFTKHLAEIEVDKCRTLFPCGIVRPSMSKYRLNNIIKNNYTDIDPTLILLLSSTCMEGTSSRLDDLEERSPRVFDGRIKGSSPSSSSE